MQPQAAQLRGQEETTAEAVASDGAIYDDPEPESPAEKALFDRLWAGTIEQPEAA